MQADHLFLLQGNKGNTGPVGPPGMKGDGLPGPQVRRNSQKRGVQLNYPHIHEKKRFVNERLFRHH